MTIRDLTSIETIAATALLPVYTNEAGYDGKATLALIAAAVSTVLGLGDDPFTQQFASPSAAAFTVSIVVGNTWLPLTPTGTLASGTITLPSDPSDGAQVLVSTTQEVTALTVNGGTIVGAPTTITAGGFFRLKYSAVLEAWHRVG